MIKSNLAVLMAERGLKMNQVIERTGIAKATIQALYHNRSRAIHFHTIDQLCDFFDVSVGELLSRHVFKLQVNECSEHGRGYFLKCSFDVDAEKFNGNLIVDFVNPKDNKLGLRIIIWSKLWNKIIAAIPETYFTDQLETYITNNIAGKETVLFSSVEVALFDTEIDDLTNNLD